MHRAYHPAPAAPTKRPLNWLGLLPWLALVYLATGFYSVQPNERAVVRRFGKALPLLSGPGLHFGFPYGIDRVTRVKVAELKRVAVGAGLSDRVLGRQSDPQQSECLTGDRNLIAVSAIVQYRVADPFAYSFHVADVAGLVESVVAAKLSAVVSSMNVDDVLTVERIDVQNKAMQFAQKALDQQQAGVEVTAVSLEGVAAPQEVAEAFRDVTSAREDRQRAINEAEGYANRLIPQARGQAQRLLLEAEGYREEVTQKAQGDAERFLKILGQLAGSRELTVRRLILETMEEVLPRLRKIVVDHDAHQELDLGLIETQP